MNDFTFCGLDLSIDDHDRNTITKEALKLPKNAWHYDKFRNTSITWIYYDKRRKNYDGIKDYDFTSEAIKYMPYTVELIKDLIFPFMKPLGRVTILDTPKDTSMNVHIDSKKSEIGIRRHKFRLSLLGEVDKLYFLDKDKNKVYVPNKYHTYILDGTHPHSIDAGSRKMTLCIGSPWSGESTTEYEYIISKSLFKQKISRPNIESLWEDERYDKKNR